MSYIKRLLERESNDGTIYRYGNRQAELYASLLEDAKFARSVHNAPAREAYKRVTQQSLFDKTTQQISDEIFGD